MARARKLNNKIVEVDGIKFQSKMEAQYYVLLKNKLDKKQIKGFKLQPCFELLEAYIVVDGKVIKKSNPLYKKYKNSKEKERDVQGVTYSADFIVYIDDEHTEVIDVKGRETEAFTLKRKLFDTLYPEHRLKLVTWYQGQWMDTDKMKKEKSKRKRERNKKKRQEKAEFYKERALSIKENKNFLKLLSSIQKDKVLTKTNKKDLTKDILKEKGYNKDEINSLLKEYCK